MRPEIIANEGVDTNPDIRLKEYRENVTRIEDLEPICLHHWFF